MKVVYWKDTDTMYITVREDAKGYESEEIAPGVVADFDEAGKVLGLEIYDRASEKVDLSVLATEGLPVVAKAAPEEKQEASKGA
ncbi:MAG: DUF2283 domain-containing protein [Rubrobacter sp.]|jgi:uncharacterized protein YuzE|nr:DUF2283 domain-containing protein [Rubrobacter sp.]